MIKKVICMGIESTAHTFGIGIVNSKGEILADTRHTLTTKKGGIIPNEAANHHRRYSSKLLKKALKKANLTMKDINLIAIANSPGLAPALVAGKDFSINLAKENNLPIIGVNHIAAHLEIGKLLTDAKDPVFVFVSGANTQIIAYEGKKYRIFGETLSIGLGNALDKFGRGINLGFPAGPTIEKLAQKGKYIELPYNVKGMDVEFSGIVTSALNKYKKGTKKEDLCYSIQETCFSMLTEVTERAMAHTNKREALIIGGVAANKRFIEMLNIMCKERNAKTYACPLKYCGDQGTQIAWLGLLMDKAGSKDDYTLDINPRLRIDEIEVNWI